MCKKSNLPDFRFWFIQFVNLDLYSFNHSFNMFWKKLIQKNIHFFCQRVSFNSKIIHSKEIPANSFKKNIHFFENWRIGQGYEEKQGWMWIRRGRAKPESQRCTPSQSGPAKSYPCVFCNVPKHLDLPGHKRDEGWAGHAAVRRLDCCLGPRQEAC